MIHIQEVDNGDTDDGLLEKEEQALTNPHLNRARAAKGVPAGDHNDDLPIPLRRAKRGLKPRQQGNEEGERQTRKRFSVDDMRALKNTQFTEDSEEGGEQESDTDVEDTFDSTLSEEQYRRAKVI